MFPTRRLWLLGLFSFPALFGGFAKADAQEWRLRISTENALDHVQTQSVERFAALVQKKAGDRIVVEFHPEARLYRDRDVIRAIGQGRVEMAVPGIWQFDRFVPDAGLFFLPMLYGQDGAMIDNLRDGKIGGAVNERIEDAFGTKVLGRWIDLGHAHFFSLRKPIKSFQDVKGMVVRTPGGEASALRLAAQKARPVSIAWPDLPTALRNGDIDGLVTTHETAVSAKLWTYGVRCAFEDRAYFAQYIPLISASYWKRLPRDLRQAIKEAWEESVEPSRQAAALAQANARKTLIDHGVAIVAPSKEDIAKARNALMERQDDMVRDLGIDPDLADMARKIVEEAP